MYVWGQAPGRFNIEMDYGSSNPDVSIPPKSNDHISITILLSIIAFTIRNKIYLIKTKRIVLNFVKHFTEMPSFLLLKVGSWSFDVS